MSGDSEDPILVGLHSLDPEARVRALHLVCPCSRGGFQRYQRYMDETRRLQKDRDPSVREAALHIQVDLIGLECIERRGDRMSDHQADLVVRQRNKRRRTLVMEKLRARTI